MALRRVGSCACTLIKQPIGKAGLLAVLCAPVAFSPVGVSADVGVIEEITVTELPPAAKVPSRTRQWQSRRSLISRYAILASRISATLT